MFVNRSPLMVFCVACLAGDHSTVTLHGSEVGSLPGAIPDAFQERPGNVGVCKECTLNPQLRIRTVSALEIMC
jgi:hypothetical protein